MLEDNSLSEQAGGIQGLCDAFKAIFADIESNEEIFKANVVIVREEIIPEVKNDDADIVLTSIMKQLIKLFEEFDFDGFWETETLFRPRLRDDFLDRLRQLEKVYCARLHQINFSETDRGEIAPEVLDQVDRSGATILSFPDGAQLTPEELDQTG